MSLRMITLLLALGCALLTVLLSQAQDQPARQKSAGASHRDLWTTSQLRGSPDPPSPYKTELAFPKLKFDEPLDITSVPGSDRLYVTERYGRIFSLPNDQKVEKPDLLLDVNELLGRTAPKSLAVYGFAAHPKYAQNGFVYVTYVADPSRETPLGTRVARFHVAGDPPRAETAHSGVNAPGPADGRVP